MFKKTFLLPWNLQQFNGEGGTGSGGAAGAGAGVGAGADGAGGGSGSNAGAGGGAGADGGNAGGSGAGGVEGKLSMTQAELDKMINDRIKRAEQSTRKAVEDEIAEKSKQASMTELEKANAAKTDAENKAKDAFSKANATLVNAEAKILANSLGVKPEKLAHLLKLVDLSGVEVDESGKVDDKAVKTAIEAILKDVPEFVATGSGKGGGDFGGGNSGEALTLEQIGKMTPDEINANWDRVQKAMSGTK